MPTHPNDPALHEMNPTTRFSDRAEDYVRYRPSYPPAAIDCVLEGLGDPLGLSAADIGAGTGISAVLLAERGVRVYAIEPNAAMRESALPHERIEWRAATGEATGLENESVDLVLTAQAFHWFRQHDAIEEFHRILKPGGRLAILWNRRDRVHPLTRGYVEAIHVVNGEHPAEKKDFDPRVVHVEGLFTVPHLSTFDHAQELDRAGLIGRATSASYVPREGEAFERLTGLLGELFDRYRDSRGLVTMRYITEVHLAARI